MIGLMDGLKIASGVALGAVLTFWPAKYIGVQEGRQEAVMATLEKSVTNLRERNVIDEKITSADASALCSDLGLSDDHEIECVRRLEKPKNE